MEKIKRIHRYASALGIFAAGFVVVLLTIGYEQPSQRLSITDPHQNPYSARLLRTPQVLASVLDAIAPSVGGHGRIALKGEQGATHDTILGQIDLAIQHLDELTSSEGKLYGAGLNSRIVAEVVQSARLVRESFNRLQAGLDSPKSMDTDRWSFFPVSKDVYPFTYFHAVYRILRFPSVGEIAQVTSTFFHGQANGVRGLVDDQSESMASLVRQAYGESRRAVLLNTLGADRNTGDRVDAFAYDWLIGVIRVYVNTLSSKYGQLHTDQHSRPFTPVYGFILVVSLCFLLLVIARYYGVPVYGVPIARFFSRVVRVDRLNASATRHEEEKHRSDSVIDDYSNSSVFVHELQREARSGVNGLIGIVALLSRSGLGARQQHFVRLLDSTARSLLRVLGDIADYEKLNGGDLSLNVAPFDLHDLFMKVSDTCAVNAIEKNLEFILDLDPESPMLVLSDSARLSQIVGNIGSIAINLAQSGDIVLELSSVTTSDDTCCLAIAVRFRALTDESLSLDTIGKMFNDQGFLSSDGAESVHQSLLLTERLCSLFGGFIDIERGLDGTIALVARLPVGLVNEWRMGVARAKLRGVCVFLLTANESMVRVLTRLMNFWSIKVVVCKSSHELEYKLTPAASDAVAEIILVDDKVGHDGLIALKEMIAQIKARKWPSLIVMTSVVNPYADEQRELYGASASLTKPVKPVDLISVLNQALFYDWKLKDDVSPVGVRHYPNSMADNASDLVWLLVVEDNQISQFVLQEQLNDIGVRSFAVTNGQEALDELMGGNGKRYQAILMDCLMPVMNGYEATHKIRNGECGECYKDIPIIAMTGNAMDGDRKECIDAGMSDYLTKPVDELSLVQTLRKWVDLVQRDESAASNAASNELIEQSELIWDEASMRCATPELLDVFYRSLGEFDLEFDRVVSELKVAIQDRKVDQVISNIDTIYRLVETMGGIRACRQIDAFKSRILNQDWLMASESLKKMAHECRLVRHFSEREMCAEAR